MTPRKRGRGESPRRKARPARPADQDQEKNPAGNDEQARPGPGQVENGHSAGGAGAEKRPHRIRIRELRMVPAGELQPHAKNYRLHRQHQRDMMASVLEEIGYADALLAREGEDGRLQLIDGHLRTELSADQPVPVLVLDVSAEEADKILATHDPIGAMADIDTTRLAELLEGLTLEHKKAFEGFLQKQGDRNIDHELERFSTGEQPQPREVDLGEPIHDVVVECGDEEKQKRLYERLTAEGLTCRVISMDFSPPERPEPVKEPPEVQGPEERPVVADVRCKVDAKSYRVKKVASMFDLKIKSQAGERFAVTVPTEAGPWRIGAIVGPSGSGKTTIAREAFGECLHREGDWPAEGSVLDGFPSGGDDKRSAAEVEQITGMLTAVGFSSPPAWLKPFAVLSNGERFRCELAKAMLSPQSLVVFDEFTSVVDRQVAQVGSAAVAKAIRKGHCGAHKKLVVVTCHYDVLDWLQPDWVLDMATQQLARGWLRRRPAIALDVVACRSSVWGLFAKHHYLSHSLPAASACYLGLVAGQPVGFAAVAGMRAKQSWKRKAGGRMRKRLARIVILPDWQGIGIGGRMLDAVCQIESERGAAVSITTTHPAMVGYCQRSPRWKLANLYKPAAGAHRIGADGVLVIHSLGRVTCSFRFLPEGEPENG